MQKKSMKLNNYFIDRSIQRHLQRFDWIGEQKKAEIDEGRWQVKAREEQTQIDTQRERDTDQVKSALTRRSASHLLVEGRSVAHVASVASRRSIRFGRCQHVLSGRAPSRDSQIIDN